ncbi:MAG TPA: DUF1343 domain-containing protein, partial [Acidobacteriota bacterium]|nr:DUF1343 domain-containing protein [Acidobacteriota bacterium]
MGSKSLAWRLLCSITLLLFLCLSQAAAQSPIFKLQIGADRITQEPYRSWFQGKRIGLITNPTGVNSRLDSTVEVFRHAGFTVTTLFGPEHGLTGEAQAGQKVENQPRLYSLYGEHRAPTAEMLSEVDLLVYDIQDVGVRFYTYISTMFLSMKAAADKGVPFVVLDRPNPINGIQVEGPVLESAFQSFVGIFQLPIRYGLTAGELARFLNH